MFLYMSHFIPSEGQTLESIKQKLSKAGLISVREEMSKVFNKRMSFLDIKIPPPIDISSKTEILARSDAKGICHIRTGTGEKNVYFVDIHIIASDEQTGAELVNTCKCITDQCDTQQGTFQEAQLVQQLNSRITDSVNGKTLKDERVATVATDLFDPEIRNSIKEVTQLFGQDAIPKGLITERIGRAVSGKKAAALTRKLVDEEKWFDKRYVLACDSCGTPALEFPDKESATRSLESSSSKKCKICEEGKLRVIEAYAVKEAVYKGLQQGLWLEKLVYETVKPLSVFAAVGQIVDPFEIDVIAVNYGRIILLDCKDTSFGQNDFININAKAEEVGAGIIGIVTTQPLHENVNRLIERTQKQTRKVFFTVQDISDPIAISSHIQEEMAKIRKDYLQQLLSSTDTDISSWWKLSNRLLLRY